MAKINVDQSSRFGPKKMYAMKVMNRKIVPKVVPEAPSWGIMIEMTLVIWPRRWSTRRHLRIWQRNGKQIRRT